MNELLSGIYFNPSHPASYGSVNDLYQAARDFGYKRHEIKTWLEKQDVYTLHKQVNRKIKRPRVVVSNIDQQWDGDTISMTAYYKSNKGYKYVLVLIDIFTRFVWTVALKTLTGKEMVKALRSVFKVQKPIKLRTDSGSEFKNKWVRGYLTGNDVHHFTTTNEVKANFAERVIKTLKTKITRHMHKARNHQWLNILSQITDSYNKSKHRSIKLTPSQARQENATTLWNNQYGLKSLRKSAKKPPKEKTTYKFKVGDRVRLARYRTPFERAYFEKWTYEIFTITTRDVQQSIPLYQIKSWDNEPIKGKFYEQELEKVEINDDTEYVIEEIIRKKKINGRVGYIVKWYGCHSS